MKFYKQTPNLVFALFLVAGIGGLSTSCAMRVPLTQVQTIQLNSNQAIGVIAEANNSVAQVTISLNAAGSLSPSLTASILSYNKLVAQAVKAAVTVQQGTASDTDKAVAVLSLFASIKLPADISSFVNSPNAPQQVASLITLLKTTITSIQALVGH